MDEIVISYYHVNLVMSMSNELEAKMLWGAKEYVWNNFTCPCEILASILFNSNYKLSFRVFDYEIML